MAKRKYPKRRSDPPLKIAGTRGFSLGLNQLTHPSTIADNELAESQNTIYSQNGVLSKRPGTKNLGTPRSGAESIKALGAVYAIGNPAKDYVLRISNDGILQKYDFDAEDYVDVVGSPTFPADHETQILQAYGFVYFLNQGAEMVKWDGSAFTTFTAIANPTTAPTLTKQGSGTGQKTYYYRYVYYNAVGNTLASSSATLANMPDTLDATTYAQVAIPGSIPSGVTKIGIFKGTISGEETYLDSIPASQTTFEDKGFTDNDPLYGVPASNTTAGFHFKYATVYRDTLIGITTELGDHTLVFSGGGDKFDSFGRADGGGYYSWRKDDGDPITGLAPYQEELYVFKRGKIGAFKFDEEGGAVRDINLAVGAVSHRSIHAAGNDLRFWSRDGAMSLGNEPNFANIIRTRVLSARADRLVKAMTPSEFRQISGVYFEGLSLWGIPLGVKGQGITSTIVYDEKYVSWSEWVGMQPKMFTKFIDEDEVEHLYYADAQSANTVEAWQGSDDRGNPIVWRVATKQFDMNRPWGYKTFTRVYLIFGNVTGANTRITLVEDGQRSQLPLALYAQTGDQGFGVDEWGTVAFGDSTGEFSGDTSGMIIRYIDIGNKDLLSMQAVLTNNGLADKAEFMGIFFEYRQSAQQLPSNYQLVRTYE